MKKIIAFLMLLAAGSLAGWADEPAPRELANQLINAFSANPGGPSDPQTLATNITVLQKAIGADPADPALHLALATCYLAQKNSTAAMASMDKAYALSQGNPRIGMVYALTLKRNREPLKARALYAEMIAAHPDLPPLEIALASLDITIQKYEEAEGIIEKLRANAPADLAETDQGALLFMLGTCRLYQGDQPGAVFLLQGASQHLPHAVLVLALLGEACLKQGDVNEAKDFLDQALAINPKFPSALYYKGVCLEHLGHPELAPPFFQDASVYGKARLRDNGEDYFLTAMACRKLGKTGEAATYEKQAAELLYTYESPWRK